MKIMLFNLERDQTVELEFDLFLHRNQKLSFRRESHHAGLGNVVI